jgi:hypothetical protein
MATFKCSSDHGFPSRRKRYIQFYLMKTEEAGWPKRGEEGDAKLYAKYYCVIAMIYSSAGSR